MTLVMIRLVHTLQCWWRVFQVWPSSDPLESKYQIPGFRCEENGTMAHVIPVLLPKPGSGWEQWEPVGDHHQKNFQAHPCSRKLSEELSGKSLQQKTFRRTFRQIPAAKKTFRRTFRQIPAAENFQKNFQVDPCSRKEQKYFSPTMFKAWKCSWTWFDQHRRLIHHICSTGRNVEVIFGPHKSA